MWVDAGQQGQLLCRGDRACSRVTEVTKSLQLLCTAIKSVQLSCKAHSEHVTGVQKRQRENTVP